MNEDRLIAWLKRRVGGPRIGGPRIGDDAAIVPGNDGWAVTVDTQIAGVHFREPADPAHVARRLLAVNLSDLAAMGAEPVYAFLALATPKSFDHRRFLAAFVGACENHGVELAGGDLASSATTTAVATLLGRRSGRRWVERSAARNGENLWLGGTVGEAALGWRLIDHGARLVGRKVYLPDAVERPRNVARAARRAVRRQLLPRPQLALGSWLGNCRDGAGIDVSDGLARDLHRLCSASGVGAEIDVDRLPLPHGFRRLASRLGCDWQELALGGGEDYVLLFTLPPAIEPPGSFACTRIGSISKAPGVFLRRGGTKRSLPPMGWDHLDKTIPGADEKSPEAGLFSLAP